MVQERETSDIRKALQRKSIFSTRQISFWAFLLSVIGFLAIAIMLAGGIVNAYNMGIVRGDVYGHWPLYLGAGYLLVSVLLFFPTCALFSYSIKSLKKSNSPEMQPTLAVMRKLKPALRLGSLLLIGGLLIGGLSYFMG